jgi:hypothetical protein
MGRGEMVKHLLKLSPSEKVLFSDEQYILTFKSLHLTGTIQALQAWINFYWFDTETEEWIHGGFYGALGMHWEHNERYGNSYKALNRKLRQDIIQKCEYFFKMRRLL